MLRGPYQTFISVRVALGRYLVDLSGPGVIDGLPQSLESNDRWHWRYPVPISGSEITVKRVAPRSP